MLHLRLILLLFFSPLDTVPIRFKGICSTIMLLLCSMRSKRERTPLYRNSIFFRNQLMFSKFVFLLGLFSTRGVLFFLLYADLLYTSFLPFSCTCPTKNCLPATAMFSSCQSLLMFSFVILFCYNYINSCLAVCMLPEIYTWFSVYCCVNFKLFACFSKWILVKYT